MIAVAHHQALPGLDRLGLVIPPEDYPPLSPALPFLTAGRLRSNYAKAFEAAPLMLDGRKDDASDFIAPDQPQDQQAAA